MKASTLFTAYLLTCLFFVDIAQHPTTQPTHDLVQGGLGQILLISELTSESAHSPSIWIASSSGFAPVITDRQATSLALPIAVWSQAKSVEPVTIIHLATTAASYAALNYDILNRKDSVGSRSPGEANGALWIVIFSGKFTPKRIPPGIKPPIYSRLAVYVDMHGLGIIGISMGGEKP